jgi:subtilase family serine protease
MGQRGAPNAAIVMATCANTTTTFGGLIAIENLVNGSRPPAIISQSYHECEASNGAAANAAFNSIYQQGVAEGISFFNSAGDAGAARCNGNDAIGATYGIGVNAYASTPYNVAVGGTDFSDTFSGTNSTYWNSTNSATYGSAKSYIPEIPWNDTCGSQLLATYLGFSTTYGASGFCNSSAGSDYLDLWAGSGGPSGCATGSPSIPGVVSGTCQGYAKPSWQRGLIGNPNDGVRDLPDVSLFASNGPWRHSYVFCFSDAGNGGLGCTGAPSNWNYGGGTSFATPIMAGLQALVNQSTGRRQGNPNYVYYAIAADEYGTSGSSACNSSDGNTVSTSCIFYDVTQGDNDVDCTGSYDCYIPSGTYGVLSTSDTSFAPAYQATAGWDFATGIGTINAYNLVTCWRQQRCRQLRP